MILLCECVMQISQELDFFGCTFQVVSIEETLDNMDEIVEPEFLMSDQELINSLNSYINSGSLRVVRLFKERLASLQQLAHCT